jgi:hypothetical protein
MKSECSFVDWCAHAFRRGSYLNWFEELGQSALTDADRRHWDQGNVAVATPHGGSVSAMEVYHSLRLISAETPRGMKRCWPFRRKLTSANTRQSDTRPGKRG